MGAGDIFRLKSSVEESRRGETNGTQPHQNWLRAGSRGQDGVALKVAFGIGWVDKALDGGWLLLFMHYT